MPADHPYLVASRVALSQSDERSIDLALDRLNDPVDRLIGALAATGTLTTDIMNRLRIELKEPFVCDAEWATAFKEFYPNTRKAIHEGVDKWRNESSCRLLWILGDFGMGKTTYGMGFIAGME